MAQLEKFVPFLTPMGNKFIKKKNNFFLMPPYKNYFFCQFLIN